MFTKKSISLQKLANGKYVFEIQPTIIIWIITVATSTTQIRMTQIPRYSCKPDLNFRWFSWPNVTEIYPDTSNSSRTPTVFCFPSEFELPVVIISSLRQWLLTINVKETTVKSISQCCTFTPNFANYHTRLMSNKHLKSVCVFADFYGEYQNDQEAKHNRYSICYVWCLVTKHKLNFEFLSQTQ